MKTILAPDQLVRLSALWDEAQGLDDESRARLLERIRMEEPALHRPLLAMLDDECALPGYSLETLPKFIDGLAADPDSDDGPAAGDIVGSYRLTRRLGDGGAGSVWLAERIDGLVDRPVALKLPHLWLVDSTLAQRFRQERAILARLEHPGIARLYDVGVSSDGHPYLVLEYVQGQPVTIHCNELGLDIRARLALFLQILRAVQYAHDCSVVHRDLKPSNILATAEGQVRLLDFGIAKLLGPKDGGEATITQIAPAAMTLSYAAPEQLTGEEVGTATDVYTLGVLMCELLGGRRPYRSKMPSRAAIEQAILAGDIELPSDLASVKHAQRCGATLAALRSQLKGDLDAIAMTAMKRNPRDRYVSAQAFADDVQRYIEGRAVLARPDGVLYRMRRTVTRHRGVSAALTIAAVSLTVGLVAALLQGQAALEQSRIAQQQSRTAEAALSFLEQTFKASSNAEHGAPKARSVTARELLDGGARQIDAALSDAPHAKLRLLRTLGEIYHEMNLIEESLTLARKRVALARAVHGPADPELLDAMLDLAEQDLLNLDYREGDALLGEVRAVLDACADSTSMHRGRVLLLTGMSTSTGSQKLRPEISLRLLDEAVSVLRKYPVSTSLVWAVERKASMLHKLGRYRPARESLLLALELMKSKTFATAPGTRWLAVWRTSIHSTMSVIEMSLGNSESAEEHAVKALESEIAVYGEGSKEELHAALDVGRMMLNTSRFNAVVSLLNKYETAADRKPNLTDRPLQALRRSFLGEALVRLGRPQEALRSLQLPDDLKDQAAFPYVMAPWLERCATAHLELGNLQRAKELLSQATDWRRKTGMERLPVFNNNLTVSAQLALASGEPDAAIAIARRFILPAEQISPLSPNALDQRLLIAEAEMQKGNSEQALQHADEVRQHIASRQKKELWDWWLQRADVLSGRAFLRTGNPAEARKMLLRSLELAQRIFDPASPAIGAAHAWLGMADLALGDKASARRQLVIAAGIHARHAAMGAHHKAPLVELRQRLKSA